MKKQTTTKPATKKSADKPTKADRVKGRIARTKAVLAKYDTKREKRLAKLAALETLLASLSKKS